MKKVVSIALPLSTFFFAVQAAFAQVTPAPLCPSGFGSALCGLTSGKFGPIIGSLISLIFVIAVIIALLYLIWGGVKWITSGGDKGKVDTARSTIIAAVVGLIVAFLAYFIISVVLQFFGLGSITSLSIPTLPQ